MIKFSFSKVKTKYKNKHSVQVVNKFIIVLKQRKAKGYYLLYNNTKSSLEN